LPVTLPAAISDLCMRSVEAISFLGKAEEKPALIFSAPRMFGTPILVMWADKSPVRYGDYSGVRPQAIPAQLPRMPVARSRSKQSRQTICGIVGLQSRIEEETILNGIPFNCMESGTCLERKS